MIKQLNTDKIFDRVRSEISLSGARVGLLIAKARELMSAGEVSHYDEELIRLTCGEDAQCSVGEKVCAVRSHIQEKQKQSHTRLFIPISVTDDKGVQIALSGVGERVSRRFIMPAESEFEDFPHRVHFVPVITALGLGVVRCQSYIEPVRDNDTGYRFVEEVHPYGPYQPVSELSQMMCREFQLALQGERLNAIVNAIGTAEIHNIQPTTELNLIRIAHPVSVEHLKGKYDLRMILSRSSPQSFLTAAIIAEGLLH